MACNLCELLLIAFACFETGLACSCPMSYLDKTRDQTIREDFDQSTNVYSAVVSAADCKCYPNSTISTRVDCLNFVLTDNDLAYESVQVRYECQEGFSSAAGPFYDFSQCQELRSKLLSMPTAVDVNPDPLPPITNVTSESCGLTEFYGEGCQLSLQACVYNVTVGTVYKGNLASGDVLATSGPDVLTSCGNIGLVLTLGMEYVIGIGGPCFPISEWSALTSYSEDEVTLLENLHQCQENPSICEDTMPPNNNMTMSSDDSSNSAAGHYPTSTFLLTMIAVLSYFLY